MALAANRLLLVVKSRLKDAPKLRSIPVRTIRTANKSSMVAPINLSRKSMIAMPRLLWVFWSFCALNAIAMHKWSEMKK